MAEQVDTTLREVLSQMSQANLVRLFPWFLSATANPSAGPICSVSEALATVMQPRMDAPADNTTSGFEGYLAPVSMCSPVYQASTPPPLVLPVLDILAAGIPIGLPFFKLAIGPKHKKWDFSPNRALSDQNGKRTLAETMEANTSSEHILSFAQP